MQRGAENGLNPSFRMDITSDKMSFYIQSNSKDRQSVSTEQVGKNRTRNVDVSQCNVHKIETISSTSMAHAAMKL